jgi:hypothetical protein
MRLCNDCGRMAPASHFYRNSAYGRCRGKLKWPQERRYRLICLIDEGRSEAEIAGILGCTTTAVRLARKRYHVEPVKAHSLSATDVMRIMGLTDAKTVTMWIERGFLHGRRIRQMGPYRQWQVRRDDLYAFLEDEQTWHLWRVERITDRMIRRYAEQVRGTVRFLTSGEVAARMFVQHGAVNHWIHMGYLPARKWGNWWIDERDLETFEKPPIGGGKWRTAA